MADLEVLRLDARAFEALRLADHQGLYHEAAARVLGVSRQSFSRILAEARQVVARALCTGAALEIEHMSSPQERAEEHGMIAISTEEGRVADHYGHAAEFSLYPVQGDEIAGMVSTDGGCGCKSGLAGRLASKGVKTLITGSIGAGAFSKLAAAGITVHAGFAGTVAEALRDLRAGKLEPLSSATCEHHHDHDHGDGHHHGHGQGHGSVLRLHGAE